MNIDLSGKVALITGASEGIGYETARVMGECGAKVAICARRMGKLEEAKAALEALGIEVMIGSVDVAKTSQFRAFADEVEAKFGKIDILVNNAGFMPFCQFKDMSEDLWQDIVDINLKSVFIGSQIAYEKMKDHGGVILNAASFSTIIPSVGYGGYAMTKTAITSMTRTLASELAPYGIRVVGYIPGFFDTTLTKESQSMSGDKLLEPIPLRRFGRAEEIAYALTFAASEYAEYMTGTCLEVTGGKFSTQNPMTAWALNK